jgi:exopolysaccharide biosynthesis operon protein EpsL
LLGRTDTGDNLVVLNTGVSFDQRYSLQKVHAEIEMVDYHFQRFSQFDLTAANYNLRWDWAYTPHLHGRLLAERDETLNSFDGTAAALSRGNRRLRTLQGVDLVRELDGEWSVQTGLFQRQDRRDLAAVGEDDFRQNTLEAGVRRSLGTGSHVTARVGRSEGRNPNSTMVTDDRYQQNNLWLDFLWAASGLTKIDLNLNSLNRSHPAAAGMDYHGLSASTSVRWQPTGKLLWTLTGASVLDSYQSLSSTHARTVKLGLNGLWTISPRTSLRASVLQSRLRLLGHPDGGSPNARRDKTLETAVTFLWKLDELLMLDASVQNSKRDSNQALFDYSSTQFSVGINVRF